MEVTSERITELWTRLDGLKRGATAWTTNCFVGPGKVAQWAEQRELEYLEVAGALLLFRRRQTLRHVYHFAANLESLSAALEQTGQMRFSGAPRVVDLVGKWDQIAAEVDVYRKHQFADYCQLRRMVGRANVEMALGEMALGERALGERVRLAGAADLDAIGEFLDCVLDPLADQQPTRQELIEAVERGQILIPESTDSRLRALLLFEVNGSTATLRYWYVRAEEQGRGLGRSLLAEFFRRSAACRRILLWVRSNNDSALAIYEHYGFGSEGLVDQILVSGRPNA